MREEGMGDDRLVRDGDLFRFAYDGTFAFSRKHANRPELR